MVETLNHAEQVALNTQHDLLILGIAGVALTFLIKYFIASKDKNTEVIMKDIKEIKESFNRLTNENNLLNTHITYGNTTQKDLIAEVTKLRDTVHGQSRTIERFSSFKTTTERTLADLTKNYNQLKNTK